MVTAIAPKLYPSHSYVRPKASAPGDDAPLKGADRVELSSSQQAAQLPLLDPTFQLALAGGIFASLQMASQGPEGGGHGESMRCFQRGLAQLMGLDLDRAEPTPAGPPKLPYLEIFHKSKSGDQSTDINYSVDLSRALTDGQAMSANGSYHQAPVSGAASVNLQDGSLQWKVKMGEQLEALEVKLEGSQDSPSLHIVGRQGQVATDLTMELTDNPVKGQEIPALHVVGELGGQRYETVTVLALGDKAAASIEPQPPYQPMGRLINAGKLGDQPIKRSYEVHNVQSGSGLVFKGEGGGENAGVRNSATTELFLVI